jgi:hypothetical protein
MTLVGPASSDVPESAIAWNLALTLAPPMVRESTCHTGNGKR